MLPPISILDSTLRDGAQAEHVALSVNDKLAIARLLDDFGVSYIEAGNPASNPKDLQFFHAAQKNVWRRAKICAFGSTRHKDVSAAADENLQNLLAAATPVVVIFGKAWDWHVAEILRASPAENLAMIADSIAFLRDRGREVIFDAEHFFAGFAANPDYALSVIAAASSAAIVTLCDTNGGMLPTQIYRTVQAVAAAFPQTRLGIHAHNDSGCAVANSLVAVEAGATHVQGTFIGVGERCGNADLGAIIAGLQLKKLRPCDGALPQLCDTAAAIAAVLNLKINNQAPYVGDSAFAHKAGMHIDGVLKNSGTFEHIDPAAVGNRRRFLLSEVAGRGALLAKINAYAPQLRRDSAATQTILAKLKEREFAGYQYEAADASFELLVKKIIGQGRKFFSLVLYKTIGEFPSPENETPASAMIKIEVAGETAMAAATGNGPVNALDLALRRALATFYPRIGEMFLTDFKVRVIDDHNSTAAKVRVLIDSSDGKRQWTTIGVSGDVIEASLQALIDAAEYHLAIINN
ncbi:citramalate synthase [Planctomycetales bacterium]|nr:citramalate synthase [Planctomycetales bacterium]GHT00353.1 citramalate synthase [Planctomycetales bacterium]GHT03179.1 citramalate synthase [Planctomycetales bacterium]